MSTQWQTKRKRASQHRVRPFAGVDGEGGNINGEHVFLLLRAGSTETGARVLETGAPLTVYECLAFLADLPLDFEYVTFAFDYDVTMILRKLPAAKIARIFDRESRAIKDKFGKHTSRYWPVSVGNGDFEIDYLPHKEFRVRRTGKQWVVISDTFTFFQSSFVNALRNFYDDGTMPWVKNAIERIAEGKELRNEFTYVTADERKYNNLECILLERMMEKFRDLCFSLGIRPARWQGPGHLVSAVFKREGVPRKQFQYVPQEVWYNANAAYYGGRFEAAAYGDINQTVYQYDINSAYASTYRDLPCLQHGTWERIDDVPTNQGLPHDGIYFADTTFTHRKKARWYTLPVRSVKGTLLFPQTGRGWYWHPELAVAAQHADITIHQLYRYERNCDCRFFDWVYDLYGERDRVGKKSGKGKVLKIVLATIYGKVTQSIGHPAYANPIWAGIVVSTCRATLIAAALQKQGGQDVLMLATDGMFCLQQRDLPISTALGDWEEIKHDNMFIVMSGVYFLPGTKPKTRGVPQGRIIANEARFRTLWRDYINTVTVGSDLYNVVGLTIPLTNFTSIRVAHARGKHEQAGVWAPVTKRVTFEWSSKRIVNDEIFPSNIVDYVLWTDPPPGNARRASLPSKRAIGGKQDYRELQLDFLEESLRDAPDWADRLINEEI